MKRTFVLTCGVALLAGLTSADLLARGGGGGGGGGRGGGGGGGGGGARPGGGGMTAAARPSPSAGARPAGSSHPGGGVASAGRPGGAGQPGGAGGAAKPGGAAGGAGRPGGVGGPGGAGPGAGGAKPGGVGGVGGVGGAGGVGKPGGVGGAGKPGGVGGVGGAGGVGGVGRPGGVGGIGGVGPGGINVRPGGVGVGAVGTRHVAAGALATQGGAVRNGFAAEYPGLTARWLGPTWRPLAWGALASYGGYGTEPAYYDYGTTAVYEGDSVYVNGEAAATPEQYAEQATTIAEAGQTASPAPNDEPMTVGVFGMVQGDETTATQVFQIKLNKQGLISGEYYNATTDQTTPISGSVDKKSQRAAWTIGDKKTPVYEAGIANLTKPETTMMVHFSKDRSQQFTLVRIEQ